MGIDDPRRGSSNEPKKADSVRSRSSTGLSCIATRVSRAHLAAARDDEVLDEAADADLERERFLAAVAVGVLALERVDRHAPGHAHRAAGGRARDSAAGGSP